MNRRRDVPRGVIGMIHLPALPGAPRADQTLDEIVARAIRDARLLADSGVSAALVENYGDAPFFPRRVPAITIAAMTRVVAAVRGSVEIPVGVNVLRNDAEGALAVAAAVGASFIRVNVHTGGMYTDQGWIEGRAARTLRLRERLAPDVAVLADIMVKHAAPPPGLALADAARDTWHRGLADALIVSGAATGVATDMAALRAVADAVPDAVVLAGSGVSAETVGATLAQAHGAIIGSAFATGGVAGEPVDGERVRNVMAAASD